MTGPVEHDQERPTRSAALALARLHLRTGALALARTELETLAGRDLLDDEGILDLAEVRWRTGDVTGAGEAVSAILEGADGAARADGQVDTPLAWVIAAESAAGHGRPTEARRHAERLRNAPSGVIDALFAGLPRSSAWPADPLTVAPTEATLFPAAGAGRADATGRRVDGRGPAPEGQPAAAVAGAGATRAPGFWDGDGDPHTAGDEGDETPDIDPELAAVAEAIAATEALADLSREDAAAAVPVGAATSTGADVEARTADDLLDDPDADEDLDHPDPAEALEDGLAALAVGDPVEAAHHLGLALRLEPSLAPRVLEGIERSDAPQLAFVRGDAYRLLGREREARRAYAGARRTSPTPVVDPQFDDVPAADPSAGNAADADPDHAPDPTQGDSA